MKKIGLVLLIFTFKISYTQQSIKAIYKKELVGYKTIKQDSFKTKPNRLMVADERLDHKVSPPTNSSGIRSLLFL